MKKILTTTLLLSSTFSNILFAETLPNVNNEIENVKTNCTGIKANLDTIFGLSTATAISSGIGTITATGALAVGIIKNKKDYKLDELTLKNNPAEFEKNFNELVDDIKASMKKTSNTLGNIRTGLMAGTTATSAISTGTSIGSAISADKLAKKMENCNISLQSLQIAKNAIEAEENFDKSSVQNANSILSICKEYDKENIKQLKNMMTTSAVVSAIGTGVSGTGTITSAMANKEKNKEKAKKLDTASNILAGVAIGTSGTSTTLSAISIQKAKKDSEMATECEKKLNE